MYNIFKRRNDNRITNEFIPMGKDKKMVNIQSRIRFNKASRNRFTIIYRTIKFKDEKSL